MNIEFSFTAFDELLPSANSKSKQLLQVLPGTLRDQGISVVYFNLVKMAALDSYVCTKNLHKGLADRLATFPHIKQVLIHLFDNIASSEYLIQDRARNEASFTTDARGHTPYKAQINPKCPLSHTLSTPLTISDLTKLIPSPKVTLLDHEKLFVDNYIFYSSLTRAVDSGVVPLLVYIPFNLKNIHEAEELLVNLCQAIRTMLIS